MRHKEFLESIRDRLDARALLEHYGAQNIIEVGNELIHSCLVDLVLPHHTHGDAAPSAALNSRTLLFNCFSYGGGDVLWLIQQMEGCDRQDAMGVLDQFLHAERNYSLEELRAKIEEYFEGEPDDEPIPHYNDNVLSAWRYLHPYLIEDRGISPEVLQAFRIGFDQTENKIVIPHFFNDRLVGWQKRNMDSERWPRLPGWETEPKYKASPSFPSHQTVFNYSPGAEHVVVVESALSVLKWEQWRRQNPALPAAVATFSSAVTPRQAELLRSNDVVTIFFDYDFAGWKGARKLVGMLTEYVNVRVVVTAECDPDELEERDAKWFIETAHPDVLAIPILEERIEQWKTNLKTTPRPTRLTIQS